MTTETTVERQPGPRTDRLRADIQALRAIAVGSVMVFHLWPNRLTGGYVGVDVFFVISGFLITSQLLAEIDRTGALHPGRFWARRAKRLVPASTTVLLAIGVTIVAFVPHYLWRQYFKEIIASTLQAENWLLAHDSVDYLAAQNTPSPTQHFWTLSVEEQFYVGLPLLLLATTALAAVLRLRYRRVIAPALALVAAASLGYSIWLTATTPGVAYFSTFTRAWEFALGALLACIPLSRRGHRLLPWVGLAMIVVACVELTAKTPFPGYAAALPVLGTAAVIWCGQRSAITRLGQVPPVALLGRVSYSAYLWHWPLIVLLPTVTKRPLGTFDKIGVVAVTVLLAWLSTTFIEEPVRFRPRLLGARRPLVVAAWCGSAMVLLVGMSAAVIHVQTVRDKQSVAQTKKVLATAKTCLGAQAMDPRLKPCENPALDGVLVPDPAQARADDANMRVCWGQQPDGAPKVCHVGPATGYAKRLFAIGDSHNNNLIGVYRTIADTNNWRIDVTGAAACYLTSGRQQRPFGSPDVGCAHWRDLVIERARQGGYDAIIVTHSTVDAVVVPGPGETVEAATVRGLVGAWRRLPDVPIIAIRDNPHMTHDAMPCVVADPAVATRCGRPRSAALSFDGQADAARQVPRAHVIDLSAFYCTPTFCPAVIGHVLVYRDPSHITKTYAATLEPYIASRVEAVLAN